MKSAGFNGMLAVVHVLLGMVFMAPGYAGQLPPWEITEPGPLENTKYWGYGFNDGVLPPTLTLEGGNSGQPLDPVWTITGSGDPVAIVDGRLGFHGAGQASAARIHIAVPNTYNVVNIKYFWFAFDFGGNAPTLDFGTDDSRSELLPGSLTYTAKTVGNHVEGYVNFLPQPASEWMDIQLAVGAGESAWIDNFQVGATCVPEPATVSFLALGGLGSWLARRKCQRRLRRKSGKNDGRFEELVYLPSFIEEETCTAPLGGPHEFLAYHLK